MSYFKAKMHQFDLGLPQTPLGSLQRSPNVLTGFRGLLWLWLKVPERIDYKLALLVYKSLKGVAPSYLADDLCRTADIEARHRLRSASSPSVVVRRTRLSTYGDWAFPVAASRVWNSLPHHVTSAQSLPVFCSRLKTHLFSRSFLWLYCCTCEVTLVITDTLIAVLTYLLTYLLLTEGRMGRKGKGGERVRESRGTS